MFRKLWVRLMAGLRVPADAELHPDGGPGPWCPPPADYEPGKFFAGHQPHLVVAFDPATPDAEPDVWQLIGDPDTAQAQYERARAYALAYGCPPDLVWPPEVVRDADARRRAARADAQHYQRWLPTPAAESKPAWPLQVAAYLDGQSYAQPLEHQ